MQSLQTFGYLSALGMGTVVGSFANVCIHRLPQRQSLISPGSHCPLCLQALRPWHNIPILSFLFLGGRCSTCKTPIPWRYPLVELLGGLLYVFLYAQFHLSMQTIVFALLTTALLIVSFIDAAHKIVPDVITLPGILVGLVASYLLTPVGFGNALMGVVLGGGLLLLVAILSRGGMGGGDIKLMAMIGAFLGWQAVFITIFLGAFCGALVGVSLILLKKKRRRDPVPFGPFLAMGAFIALLRGEELISWYLYFSR